MPPSDAYVAALWLGTATFCGMIGVGVFESLAQTGAPPGLELDYAPHLKRLSQQDPAAVLPQLQLAKTIAFGEISTAWELAVAAREAGDLDLEIEGLERYLAMAPSKEGTREALATALLRQQTALGQQSGTMSRDAVERAISLLETALSTEPETASLHQNLGAAWLMLGDRNRASAHFQSAGSLDPSLSAGTVPPMLLPGN